MKSIFISFTLLILIISAKSQHNKIVVKQLSYSDSLIINSPPYRKWFSVYKTLKKDSNFMRKLNSDNQFKNLYDSTEKYYKLMIKKENKIRLFSLAFPILSIALPLPFYLTVPLLAVSVVPPFFQFNEVIYCQGKFISNCVLLIQRSDYHIDTDKWKVTKLDKKRYEIFTKRYKRITKNIENGWPYIQW